MPPRTHPTLAADQDRTQIPRVRIKAETGPKLWPQHWATFGRNPPKFGRGRSMFAQRFDQASAKAGQTLRMLGEVGRTWAEFRSSLAQCRQVWPHSGQAGPQSRKLCPISADVGPESGNFWRDRHMCGVRVEGRGSSKCSPNVRRQLPETAGPKTKAIFPAEKATANENRPKWSPASKARVPAKNANCPTEMPGNKASGVTTDTLATHGSTSQRPHTMLP